MVEFTSEDYTLMCQQSFYSEIDQEVNRRVMVVLDTRIRRRRRRRRV